VRDVIIDQHFAERGRIGRLLGAVAQNPRELGLGIDEDTAVILRNNRFEVIGSGGVYVVDGGRRHPLQHRRGQDGPRAVDPRRAAAPAGLRRQLRLWPNGSLTAPSSW
jgi:cyanophycinase